MQSALQTPFHSIYLQRRKSGTSYRDFQRLWRSHGDFAAAVPAFWNAVEQYIHKDPLENPDGLPGDTAFFDAVGELYYTSYQHWLAIRDVMWHQVAPDERRVFMGPPIGVRGDRVVHQPISGLHKLFTFARFGETVDPSAARQGLARHVEATLATAGFGDRLAGFSITQARAHDPLSGMDQLAQTTSSHDVLLIHHFADEISMRQAMTSDGYAALNKKLDEFFDTPRITVATHGWILKGTIG